MHSVYNQLRTDSVLIWCGEMYNPTTRLLSILELLQARGRISARELAQTLEVKERSVRRYITMLRDLGIPIESERGRYGGYSLRPGYRLPPLMFSGDEIVAVTAGLRLAQELASVPALSINSAQSKIERVLPPELKRRSQALQQMWATDAALPRAHVISSEWMLAISLAALEKRCLHIHYFSGSGAFSERTITPYGLVLHGPTWYLPAYCHLRGDRRTFRLDRVRSVAESGAPYEPPAQTDPKTMVLESLARIPGLHECVIILHAPRETVKDYIPASLAELEDEAGETLMRCYAEEPLWVARYLMQLEFPFTVRQPDALRAALRTLATGILDQL